MATASDPGANTNARRDCVRQPADPQRVHRLIQPADIASDPVRKDVDLRGPARDERAKRGA